MEYGKRIALDQLKEEYYVPINIRGIIRTSLLIMR